MPLQELPVTIRFRTRLSPDTQEHLRKLMTLSDTYIKTTDVQIEGDRLIIYI